METYVLPVEGKNVCMYKGKRVEHVGTVPPLSPLALLDINTAFAKLEALGKDMDTSQPWAHPKAEQLDVSVLRWECVAV